MARARVKIAAVATNEGPYLAQWFHHHNYYGFNAFDIYVNNTTDNTLEILERLRRWFAGVRIHNTDWISTYFGDNKPYCVMQHMTYLQDYYNSNDYDYVLYSDLDEFWQLINGIDTIQDCVERFNWPDCVFFNWFFLDGFEQYLTPMFAARHLYGRNWRSIKSLLRTGLTPKDITCHYPKIETIERAVIGNGDEHVIYQKEPWSLHPDQGKLEKDYFLIHDSARSLINFLSKIIVGHISKAGNPDPNKRLAHDRPMHQTMSSHKSASFDNKLPRDYYMKFVKMFKELELYEPVRRAKIHECLKALECLRHLWLHPELPVAVRVAEYKGSLSDLHDNIFAILIDYAPEYRECGEARFAVPEALLSERAEDVIAAFLPAIRLYPYTKDEAGDPLFLKSLLSYLLCN